MVTFDLTTFVIAALVLIPAGALLALGCIKSGVFNVGASKPQHLEDAVAALTVKLSPEEVARLEEPYVPHPVAGFS